MIKHTRGIAGLAFMAFLSVMQCGKDPVSSNGTGSSTETAMVKGMVYNNDGTAAKNAAIYMRKKSYLANITSVLVKTSTTTDMPLTKTDTMGAFRIEYIDTGLYVLEATDGNNNVAINISVSIKSIDSTVTLPSITLEKAGAIKGVIKLSNDADPRKVFVLAFGVDKFVKVNQDGTFKLVNLAQGKYDIRLIPVIDDYNVFDTFNISVKSADTTDLDTIGLAYSGVPKPNEVTIKYDPYFQNVTIVWDRPATSLKVQSYTIFRKNSDSTNYVIIKNGLTDTTYIDSTGLPDRTYTYGVAVVDTNNVTGVMSKSAPILTKTYFQVDTLGTFGSGPGQFQSINSIAIDKKGNFYIGDGRIQVFNSKMHYQNMIDSPLVVSPYLVNIDSEGNIYSKVSGSQMIKKIIPGATITDPFTVTDLFMAGSGDTTVRDFCIHNNELFMALCTPYDPYHGRIAVTDLNGNAIRSWPVNNFPYSISINSSDEVFVTHTDSIQIFDTLGNCKFSIKTQGNLSGKVVFDSKGRIILSYESSLWVLDSKGTMISRYSLMNIENLKAIMGVGPIAAYDNFIYVGGWGKILKVSNLLP